MSDANLEPSDETVSLDLRIDRLCDRFEFLLLAGQRVTVTDFLRGEGLDPLAVAPELLRELERLAACYHPDQRPTVAVENVPAEDASDESAGVDVGTLLAGRYKFVEKIGGGGMGDVWMAQQTAPVRRQVAVKVIKAGMDTKAVLARFDAERQALAMMDHDNIARVYDAGSTPAGRPFFVMELVKGVPITKFCDARRLPPRERLRLFLSVCEAIQHAHQKGIIHRDIKPGNVLVALCDGKPVVKVIDFGIAKATGQALTDRTLVTGLGAVVGTPEYMSPEQATLNNLDIDTRSDVYSLGVLLYELLTGFTPVDRKSLGMAALLEMLRIVREVDAPRPSDKLSTADGLPGIAANRDTEPAKLVKLFRGELDWVLLKSLEKDRGRRYQSANAFAADVRNFLADEVVEARPPSRGYRLRKFVRRNRAAVWASVAVFVALLSGIVGTTLGLLEARKQAGEAEKAQKMEVEQRAVAERMFEDMLADYRASTDDAVLNLIGSRPTLGPAEKEFLTRALVRWQAFANRVGDDERSQAIRAEGDYQVGLLLGKLDQNAEALACLRRAAAVFLALSTANPDSDAYLLRTGLAHRGHATALFLSNEASQAKTVADAAVQTLTQFVSRVPRGVEGRHALALAINNRGMYHHISGRRSEAVADYRDAEHLLAALHREDPTNGIVADALAGAQNNLGMIDLEANRLALAESWFISTITLRESMAKAGDPTPTERAATARTYFNLSKVQARRHEYGLALDSVGRAQRVMCGLVSEYPAVNSYLIDLAMFKVLEGDCLIKLRKYTDAVAVLKEATGTLQRLLALTPDLFDLRYRVGGARGTLSVALHRIGQTTAAAAESAAAREILSKLCADSPGSEIYLLGLSEALDSAVEIEVALSQVEARALLLKAVETTELVLAGQPSNSDHKLNLAKYLARIGDSYRNGRDPETSIKYLTRATAILDAIEAGAVSPDTRRFHSSVLCARALNSLILARHDAAILDLGRAIKLAHQDDRPYFLSLRAMSHAESGDFTSSLADIAADEDGIHSLTPDIRGELVSIIAEALRRKSRGAESRTPQALGIMRKLWKDGALRPEDLKNSAFDPLRTSPQFARLVEEMRTKHQLELAPPPRLAK